MAFGDRLGGEQELGVGKRLGRHEARKPSGRSG
jgi:hypothetical protein